MGVCRILANISAARMERAVAAVSLSQVRRVAQLFKVEGGWLSKGSGRAIAMSLKSIKTFIVIVQGIRKCPYTTINGKYLFSIQYGLCKDRTVVTRKKG